jgi:hypothetical protein
LGLGVLNRVRDHFLQLRVDDFDLRIVL